eukprot:762441-Hanusia_phi.AAC.2
MATAIPGTILGTVMPGGANGAFLNQAAGVETKWQIQDGQMTATVYTLIREEKFEEAAQVLEPDRSCSCPPHLS